MVEKLSWNSQEWLSSCPSVRSGIPSYVLSGSGSCWSEKLHVSDYIRDPRQRWCLVVLTSEAKTGLKQQRSWSEKRV